MLPISLGRRAACASYEHPFAGQCQAFGIAMLGCILNGGFWVYLKSWFPAATFFPFLSPLVPTPRWVSRAGDDEGSL